MTRDQLLEDVARALAEADPETAEERGHALESRLPPGEPGAGDDSFSLELPKDELAQAIRAAVERWFPGKRGDEIIRALRQRILPAPGSIEALASMLSDSSGLPAAHFLARVGDPRAIPVLLREARAPGSQSVISSVDSLCLLLRRGAARVPDDVLRSLKGLALQSDVYEIEFGEPGSLYDPYNRVGTETVDTSALDALVVAELARRSDPAS